MLNACVNCGATVVFGGRKRGRDRYCSSECEDWVRHPGFCEVCLASTTDQESGGTFRLNGFGTCLAFPRDRCPSCGSVVQTLALSIFFLPLIPLGRYRVRWANPRRFLSRRLRREGVVQRPPVVRAGKDLRAEVWITTREAAAGTEVALALPRLPQFETRVIRVRVPANVQGGTELRLPGKGSPGVDGGAPGDFYVQVRVGAARGRRG